MARAVGVAALLTVLTPALASADISVTFRFVDQTGPLLANDASSGAETAYVEGRGYVADGDTLLVGEGAPLTYRPMSSVGSSIVGSSRTEQCDSDCVLDVSFVTVPVALVDECFDPLLDEPVSGNEGVYLEQVGYLHQGERVVLPEGATVAYAASLEPGSPIAGPRSSLTVTSSVAVLPAVFTQLRMAFEDQDGPLGVPPGTGNEATWVDHIGYVNDLSRLLVPARSVLAHRPAYAPGSEPTGPYQSVNTDARVASDALVAFWHFDEGGGTLAADDVFGLHPAQLEGVDWTDEGIRRSALSLLEGNARATVDPLDFQFGLAESFSVDLWFQTDVLGAPVSLLGLEADDVSPNQFWALSLTSSGRGRFVLRTDNGDSESVVETSSLLNDGLWHQLTVVKDAEQLELRLYADGQLEEQIEFVDGETFNDGTLHLSGAAGVEVSLDEVAVWDRGLSESEVLALQEQVACGSSLEQRVPVPYQTLTVHFVDPTGQPLQGLSGRERAYVEYIGYLAEGQRLTVPRGSTLRYFANLEAGSSLVGPTRSLEVQAETQTLDVPFASVEVALKDQFNLPLEGTGAEGVWIAGIGFRADGERLIVPEGASLTLSACAAPGSALCGPSREALVNGETGELEAAFQVLTARFVDQSGPLLEGAGSLSAYIDSLGWRAEGQTLAVPLDALLTYRVALFEGSPVTGSSRSVTVDGSSDTLTLDVWTLGVSFNALELTGLERVYVDYLGFVPQGGLMRVPRGATLQYAAYYREDSVLHGPQTALLVDGSLQNLTVEFQTVRFQVIQPNGSLVDGASVLIDHVGEVSGTQHLTVPLGATLRHQAHLGDLYSPASEIGVSRNWNLIQYLYDGVGFSSPGTFVETWVQVRESDGDPIVGATVQYYDGAWHSFGAGTTSSSGRLSMMLTPGNYTFRASYAYGTLDRAQNTAQNPVVNFQTQRVRVELRSSSGELVTTGSGTTDYYTNSWHPIGSTGTQGFVDIELFPMTYYFRMVYGGVTVQLQQNTLNQPTVIFQTQRIRVELRNAEGNLITGESADVNAYYSGSGTWTALGSTGSAGYVEKDLFPLTYLFRMSLGGITLDQTKNTVSEPTVVYQTTRVSVQLRDSAGQFITNKTGDVIFYYAGSWRTFGSTGTNGYVERDLFPLTYTFRMTYGGISVDKTANTASSPTVLYQTAPVRVELRSSDGQLLTSQSATVYHYYSGTWYNMGQTGSSGFVAAELFPLNYTFRMYYADGSLDKSWDTAANPLVVFQTSKIRIELRDSYGNLLTGSSGTVLYDAAGWKTLGYTGSNGYLEREIFPITTTFRMSYANASTDLAGSTGTGQPLVFRTGRVLSTSGHATMYYAAGWRSFVQGVELLPNTYPFAFSDRPNEDHLIVASVENVIP